MEKFAMTSAQSLYTSRIREYLSQLERGDAAAICALFASDAQVYSPLLGWVSPRPFFEKLSAASGQSSITPIDVCVSTTGAARATGYFVYEWALKDGPTVRFECVDVFEFDEAGRIARLVIIYDTYPIRASLGDSFS